MLEKDAGKMCLFSWLTLYKNCKRQEIDIVSNRGFVYQSNTYLLLFLSQMRCDESMTLE